jgi:hypothetical protein
MADFEKVNVNPKERKCGDCVIRALAKASGKSWEQVYDELCEIGRKKCRMPNDDCCVDKWTSDNNFVYCKTLRDRYGNQMTVSEMVDKITDIERRDYSVIIHTKNHLTCASNGIIYDTWNTSNQKAGYYYIRCNK